MFHRVLNTPLSLSIRQRFWFLIMVQQSWWSMHMSSQPSVNKFYKEIQIVIIVITRLIVTNIILLTKIFCNCLLFCNCPLSVTCNLPLLKDNSFNKKVLTGFMWLTSNHMFGSGDFWDQLPSWFLETLKLSSFFSSNFKIFKNAIQQFIPNCLPKHMTTNINFLCLNLTALKC